MRLTLPFRLARIADDRLKGFTLLELIVTVAILGIVATLALPSFNELIADNRIRAITSELHSSLLKTRSEAIKRGKPVAICASVDQLNCSDSTNWASGWIIFTDHTGLAGERDGQDQVIFIQQSIHQKLSLTADRSRARYLPSGFMN